MKHHLLLLMLPPYLHHHQFNVHVLPRFIKGMDGCFPTAYGSLPTFSNLVTLRQLSIYGILTYWNTISSSSASSHHILIYWIRYSFSKFVVYERIGSNDCNADLMWGVTKSGIEISISDEPWHLLCTKESDNLELKFCLATNLGIFVSFEQHHYGPDEFLCRVMRRQHVLHFLLGISLRMADVWWTGHHWRRRVGTVRECVQHCTTCCSLMGRAAVM